VWGVDLPQRIPRALCGRAIRALNLIRVDHWRSAAHYARSCAHLGTILGDLAVDAVTDWEPRGPGLPRTSSPWMIRVLELVEQHLSSSTAVQRIAELLGVTREHLTRSVKAETGLSLRQILDNRRKVVASEMLCDSSRSLQQIGQAVGYSHVSSFVHAFRRWLGVTPQQYRQRRRQ
jgi:transcriptional regulator GlxA family with amidase domain